MPVRTHLLPYPVSKPCLFHEIERKSLRDYKRFYTRPAALGLPPPPSAKKSASEVADDAQQSESEPPAPAEADTVGGATRVKMVRVKRPPPPEPLPRSKTLSRPETSLPPKTPPPPVAQPLPDFAAAENAATVSKPEPAPSATSKSASAPAQLGTGLPEPLGVSKTNKDAPSVVHRASEASDRARGVGVDASKASFVRKLLHWAQLPVALVDLLAACLAAVASFGFAAPLVPIAARQLQEVWRNEPPAAAATSPRLPAPDLDRASPPVRAAVEALRSARTRFEEASQKTRIDFHRAGFLSRLLGVGAATASLGLAIAATVASGGLAAPALVVSVLLLRQAVAHAHCAWRNRQAAEAGQPTLPMGSNAVANAAYAHAKALGRPDAQARLEAARVAAGASFVVTAGCIALGAALAVAVPLVERCTRLGCAMLQRAILPTVDNQRAHANKIDLAQLRTQANLQLQRSLLDLLRARDEARLFLSAAHAEAEPDDLSALAAELGRWDLTDPTLQPLRQLLEDRLWLGLPARDRDTDAEALRERADVLSDATAGLGALVGGTSLLLQALT